MLSFLRNESTVYHMGSTSSFTSNDTYSLIGKHLRTLQEEEYDSDQGLSRTATTHSPGHVGAYRRKHRCLSLPGLTWPRCSCIHVRVFGRSRSAGAWDTADSAPR